MVFTNTQPTPYKKQNKPKNKSISEKNKTKKEKKEKNSEASWPWTASSLPTSGPARLRGELALDGRAVLRDAQAESNTQKNGPQPPSYGGREKCWCIRAPLRGGVFFVVLLLLFYFWVWVFFCVFCFFVLFLFFVFLILFLDSSRFSASIAFIFVEKD